MDCMACQACSGAISQRVCYKHLSGLPSLACYFSVGLLAHLHVYEPTKAQECLHQCGHTVTRLWHYVTFQHSQCLQRHWWQDCSHGWAHAAVTRQVQKHSELVGGLTAHLLVVTSNCVTRCV